MDRDRILILETAVDVTGSLKSVINIGRLLANRYEFLYAAPKDSRALNYLRTSGCQVVPFPFYELSRSFRVWVLYPLTLLRNYILLKKYLKSQRITLLVGNDFYNMLPPFYKLFGGRIPYVTFVRFQPTRFPTFIWKSWMGIHKIFADRIIAVSKNVSQALGNNRKVCMIYDQVPAHPKLKFLPYDKESKRILYLANYIRGKGHEKALECFALIASEFPEWKLRFVGSDMNLSKNQQYKDELKLLARKLQLDKQVEWKGFTDNVHIELMEASIVLNFSESESFSLTCGEAMYSGRPVIATRSGGPQEMIVHEKYGILVQLGSVNQMSSELKRLIENVALREEIGKNAHKRMSSAFGFDNTTGKLALHLQTVTEKSKS